MAATWRTQTRRAQTRGSESCVTPEENPGVWRGAILGELAKTGRDKATFAISPSIASFGDWVEQLTAEALHDFLAQAQPGSYIALQAYVRPTAEADVALAALRVQLRDRFQLATTAGYGPRFLHSTGQLHKGDAGRGLFIQLTADAPRDAPIPDEAGSPDSSISFGVLKLAQALGDRQALLDAGRRVIHFHLGEDVVGGLKRLLEAVG
jgi:hypothetical protein